MNENELRELQERAHQIRQLQQTSGWGLLAEYAGAARDIRLRELVHRRGATLEEHREAAGFVQGIDLILGAADDLERQAGRATAAD